EIGVSLRLRRSGSASPPVDTTRTRHRALCAAGFECPLPLAADDSIAGRQAPACHGRTGGPDLTARLSQNLFANFRNRPPARKEFRAPGTEERNRVDASIRRSAYR